MAKADHGRQDGPLGGPGGDAELARMQVRRFAPIQIVLHWGQAVLWIVLVATGGMILGEQLFRDPVVSRAMLVGLHKWVGVGLLVFVAGLVLGSLVLRRFGTMGRDVMESLRFGRADVRWLLKIPWTLIRPHAALPPTGRFNAGQKLHLVFITVGVPLFGATGLAMMAEPQALGLHVIHAGLFVLAAGFLAVHLFLSLVNPSTRRALGGILTGMVSYRYAAGHHPLWVGEEPRGAGEHEPVLSRGACAAAAGVVLLAGCGWAAWYGPGRLAGQVAQWARRDGVDAISPGELSGGHAQAAPAARCRSCHQAFAGPAATVCVDCHGEIRQALAQRTGYHGKVTGVCGACHGEHGGAGAELVRLDAAGFDHRQARFALLGAHQGVGCRACHWQAGPGAPGRMHYLGLTFGLCTDCHANPHEAIAGAQVCAGCHTEAGWEATRLRYAHNDGAGFHLAGPHAQVGCAGCHDKGRGGGAAGARGILPLPAGAVMATARSTFALVGLGWQCGECHRNPHGAVAQGPTCGRCHTDGGWDGKYLHFNHNDPTVAFHLAGKHGQVECAECHDTVRRAAVAGNAAAGLRAILAMPAEAGAGARSTFALSGVGRQCVECHAEAHKPSLGNDCTTCHGEKGWTGADLKFTHDRDSKFTLRGMHRTTACSKCHQPATPQAPPATAAFWGLGTTCTTCHKDPHDGVLTQNCTACHSENGWQGRNVRFDHRLARGRPLDAAQRVKICGACHQGGIRDGGGRGGRGGGD